MVYGYKMAVSVLVVYPHDSVADWQLQLAATAQHPKKVSYCILLVQEKTEIQQTVAIECVSLLCHCKSRIHKSIHLKLGTICVWFFGYKGILFAG